MQMNSNSLTAMEIETIIQCWVSSVIGTDLESENWSI